MSRDLSAALADALCDGIVNFMTFSGRVTAEAVCAEPWASVTFAGLRHRLRVALDGPGAVGAAADLLARLHDIELDLPGHLLADLALLAETRRDDGRYASLELEALTIEDGT